MILRVLIDYKTCKRNNFLEPFLLIMKIRLLGKYHTGILHASIRISKPSFSKNCMDSFRDSVRALHQLLTTRFDIGSKPSWTHVNRSTAVVRIQRWKDPRNPDEGPKKWESLVVVTARQDPSSSSSHRHSHQVSRI